MKRFKRVLKAIVNELQQRVVTAGLPHNVDFYGGSSGAFPGTPGGGTADDEAWAKIYGFLGKLVEDARAKTDLRAR